MNSFKNVNMPYFLCLIAVFLLAIPAGSLYRGIAHDGGLSEYYIGAVKVLNGEPLIDTANGLKDYRYPARLIYIIFIAISFKLVGFNLLALHLFPYIIQLINPLLFFIVARGFFSNLWWAFGGTLLFLTHPFNVVFLNQQYSSPFFDFFLLFLMLLFQWALKNPKYLIIAGGVASLLLYTRFEDGVIFVSGAYIAYIFQCWKNFSWKWFAASIGGLLLTHMLFALLFQFPITYPIYEILRTFQLQERYAGGLSFIELTSRAIKIFITWYFGGKFFAPFITIFLLIGAIQQIRKKIFYPLCLFVPHFLFMLFFYNGRGDVLRLALPQTVIPFLLLILSGLQEINVLLVSKVGQERLSKQLQETRRSSVRILILPVSAILLMFGVFTMKAYQLGYLFEDAIPASTMWRIVKANPPLPGHPLYKEPAVKLTPEVVLPLRLREEIYRSVLGIYRSESVGSIGQYAAEKHLFEAALIQADFSYIDDYTSNTRWNADRKNFTGTSALWNDKFSGHLGAFPCHASASFEYEFTFPHPIEYVIVHDTHSQWGLKDRMRLWTSPDGKKWTVRYGDSRARYRNDRYYQFFDDEFDGQTSLFIKYEFYAGDVERKSDDNRGASLDEFGLIVKYKQ